MKTGGVSGAQMLGSETVKSSAESLGKSPGAGFGAGMGFLGSAAGMMGAGGQQQGGAAPAGAKFCPNCGTALQGAKFCPNCGTNREEKKINVQIRKEDGEMVIRI